VPNTLIHKLLSFSPIVGVGLISYSAYLWHQPILAFTRHRLLDKPADLLLIMLCLSSLVMAYFSWRWVEKPFRDKAKVSQMRIFILSSCLIIFFITLGLSMHFNKGFPQRFSKEIKLLDQMESNNLIQRKDGTCNLYEGNFIMSNCIYGDSSATPTVALLGDSHAASITDQLSEQLERLGISFIQYTKNGCIPSFYIEGSYEGHKNCPKFNESLIDNLRQSNTTSVIIFNRLSWYFEEEGFENHLGKQEPKDLYHYTTNNNLVNDEYTQKIQNIKLFIDQLLSMGLKVYYVEPIPEQGWHVPKEIMKRLIFDEDALLPPYEKELFINSTVKKLSDLTDLINRNNFYVVNTEDIFCDDEYCYSERNGEILYYDDDHPSDYASNEIARLIVESFSQSN
jgi:hypothetical protein